MKNNDIRDMAKKQGVKLWEIASELGLSDGTFSRKLRFELVNAQKAKVFATIKQISLRSDR